MQTHWIWKKTKSEVSPTAPPEEDAWCTHKQWSSLHADRHLKSVKRVGREALPGTGGPSQHPCCRMALPRSWWENWTHPQSLRHINNNSCWVHTLSLIKYWQVQQKKSPDNPFSLRLVPLVPGGLINHNSHLLYHFTPQMQENFTESNQKFMESLRIMASLQKLMVAKN